MNMSNLAYNNQEKQPSWIDDPFDLKGTITGVNVMSHKQRLSAFAEELVYQYGKHDGEQYSLNLLNISSHDLNELTRLYMESTNRETSECVHGTDFSNDNKYTCALLAMLQNDCKETREDFAAITRINTIIYYSISLQKLLNEACHDLVCNLQNESGFHSYQDKDSGDICWSKYA